MASKGEAAVSGAVERVGRYRWVICGLLFAATIINYIDRQMIGVLKPTLMADLHWTEQDFAGVIIWFQFAYAVGYILFGKIVDQVGARVGYTIAFIVWQVAHIFHGAAHNITQFAIARFALGIGESGNFPAGIKAVTEWFPAKERAFAIGVFNAGANIGAVLTPLVIPYMVIAWGWRSAFVITGVVSFVWLIAWWMLYRSPREHPKVTEGELAWIEQDPADKVQKLGYGSVLLRRETWAYALGKFFIDPVWWFFLFWLPGYLFERYQLDLKTFGLPLAAIYLVSDMGSVAGGWLSSRLMRAGYTANVARKLTMLVCAFAVLPVLFAESLSSVWMAVAVIGIATAAHQAFSANLYALPADMFPRGAVGSVIGIGGTVGAVGGILMSFYAGEVLARIGSYWPLFAVAGSAYFVALACVHFLSPRLARVDMDA
ncbi:MFS transporter, ACS family, hexuronate transporter [Sphingomonas sp. NFR04]|uniref:MFS transporter n=1 Tax=Sphingomonas sp. NFR04 TaxID=1566283 RepID=UPI0008E932E7|nr:MFS transporter [Sphingomonas sp. NFR04]SFJ05279.1 MFS transporter, ACS family, hexuronate transporter [Sphingomonas sp. NFR04]